MIANQSDNAPYNKGSQLSVGKLEDYLDNQLILLAAKAFNPPIHKGNPTRVRYLEAMDTWRTKAVPTLTYPERIKLMEEHSLWRTKKGISGMRA